MGTDGTAVEEFVDFYNEWELARRFVREVGPDAKGDYMKLDISGSGAFRASFAMRVILTVVALALSTSLAACGSAPNAVEENTAMTSEQPSQGDSQEMTSDAGTQEPWTTRPSVRRRRLSARSSLTLTTSARV